MSILSREFRQTTVLIAPDLFFRGTHKSSEVATKGRKSSEVATTHEREHTDAAMVAIPPVLRPAWRRRLLLYVLLPYLLAGSAARAAEAPGPAPGAADDDALREDAYEWPRGPALEGLLPASAAGDEGLLEHEHRGVRGAGQRVAAGERACAHGRAFRAALRLLLSWPAAYLLSLTPLLLL